jgi:hypothetical protein
MAPGTVSGAFLRAKSLTKCRADLSTVAQQRVNTVVCSSCLATVTWNHFNRNKDFGLSTRHVDNYVEKPACIHENNRKIAHLGCQPRK